MRRGAAAGSLDALLDGIRAAADPSRLRLLAICSQGEWTVSELVPDPGRRASRASRAISRSWPRPACSTASARAAGCSTAARRPATAPGWRARSAACCRTTMPAMRARPAAAGGGARGAPPPGRALLRRARRRLGQRARARRRRRRGRGARCASCSRPSAPASLLDIGTGTGRILQVLAGAGRLRPRHRPQPRHAGGRPRQSRPARGAQLPGAPRRHVPAAAAGRLVRRGRRCIRCCTSPTTRPPRWPRLPACWPRAAGWSWSTWRRTASSGCARAAAIAGSASATTRSRRWFRRARPGRRAAAPARRPRAHGRDLDRAAPAPPAIDDDQRLSPGGTPHDAGRGRSPHGADPAPGSERAAAPVELSIEVFPPKGPEAATRLWAQLEQFVAVRPRFISVTCGAGGAGNDGTLPLVCRIQDSFGVPVAAHLTCAWSSRAEIDELARDYWQPGIRRIVALRGDPPKGSDRYLPRAGRLRLRRRPDRRPQGGGRFRDQRRLLSRGASRGRECRSRPREPAAQGRGGRHPAGHPVLLRHRPDPALSRPAGGGRDRGRVRARHHADPQLHPDQALLAGLRRRHPGLARARCSRASRKARRCTA